MLGNVMHWKYLIKESDSTTTDSNLLERGARSRSLIIGRSRLSRTDVKSGSDFPRKYRATGHDVPRRAGSLPDWPIYRHFRDFSVTSSNQGKISDFSPISGPLSPIHRVKSYFTSFWNGSRNPVVPRSHARSFSHLFYLIWFISVTGQCNGTFPSFV